MSSLASQTMVPTRQARPVGRCTACGRCGVARGIAVGHGAIMAIDPPASVPPTPSPGRQRLSVAARGSVPGRPAGDPRPVASRPVPDHAVAALTSDSPSGDEAQPTMTVLVYSDDRNTRAQVRLAVGRRPARTCPGRVRRVRHRSRPSSRRSTPAASTWLSSTARRSRPVAWARPAAQGRDLPVPAGAGAHRAPAGRLARHLVPGRRGGAPPARPGRARRRCRRPDAAALAPSPPWSDERDRSTARCEPGPTCSPALVRRHRPRRAEARRPGRMRRDHGGAATLGADRRLRVALRTKGETVDEVDGPGPRRCSTHAVRIDGPRPAVDIVGTGGDRAHTVNISTMAAHRRRRRRARVVKHGNRAASSACGPADVLEALGIRSTCTPDAGRRGRRRGRHHVLLRAGVPPGVAARGCARRELGIPTTFNFLGPLANPARPAAQAVGVADARMAGILAGVLAGRGAGARVPRRRRARRDHHHHDVACLDRAER